MLVDTGCSPDTYGDGCVITGTNLLNFVNYCQGEAEISTPSTLRVIIDSGASANKFPCDSLLHEKSIVSGWVSLGDNTKRIKICGVGKTTFDFLEASPDRLRGFANLGFFRGLWTHQNTIFCNFDQFF